MAATITDQDVLISRLFDAPPALVFKAWSSAEHLKRWYAPRGCAISNCSVDFRTGGRFHYSIQTRDGHEACWAIGIYQEIVEIERIVYTLAFADAEGNPADTPPFLAAFRWPKETLVTVTFADLGGKTELTLHQTVSESLAKQTGAYPSWLELLDRLAEDLAVG